MKGIGGLKLNTFTLALAVSAGVHAAVLAAPDVISLVYKRRQPRFMVVRLVAENREAPVNPAVPAPGWEAPPDFAGSAVSLDTDDKRYQSYFRIIKTQIARVWSYPQSARISGRGGEVIVEFLLVPSGQAPQVRIVESSGSADLDRAAAEAVRLGAPYPPPPADIRRDPFIVSAKFVYAR